MPDEALPGGPQDQLKSSIAELATAGKALKRRPPDEREDYHWEIIGGLVRCITAPWTICKTKNYRPSNHDEPTAPTKD